MTTPAQEVMTPKEFLSALYHIWEQSLFYRSVKISSIKLVKEYTSAIRREARNEGLEEAAQIAVCTACISPWDNEIIAKKIRLLKETTHG